MKHNDITKMTKAQLIEAVLETGPDATEPQLKRMKKAELVEILEASETGTTTPAPAEEAKSEKPTMADQLKAARAKYTKVKGKDGKMRTNNGDELATLLIDLSPDDVLTIAEHVRGLKSGELHERYGHLNQGQQRMNGGNMLRGFLKKGGDIKEIKALISK